VIQLILHLLGDYVLQSDWMANNKTKRFWPAWMHACVYTAPFRFLTDSTVALLVILLTHFLIDRHRLARLVVYAKNLLLSPIFWATAWWDFSNTEETKRWKWSNCSATGYPSEMPAWLAVWLLIACDNTLHLLINYAALRWL